MRRIRNGTKVWHNPDVDGLGRAHALSKKKAVADGATLDAGASNKHRAALEALFAPKGDKRESVPQDDGAASDAKKTPIPGRIVLAPAPSADPTAAERQRLLGRLLAAEGRPKISRAANDFRRAGFGFPDEQDVHLKLLEHLDEEHVRTAIDKLSALLAVEAPKRRNILESRLRRIEEFAEEPATRDAAEQLRKQVTGRAGTARR